MLAYDRRPVHMRRLHAADFMGNCLCYTVFRLNQLAHRLRAADPEQPGNLTDRRPLRIMLIAAALEAAYYAQRRRPTAG